MIHKLQDRKAIAHKNKIIRYIVGTVFFVSVASFGFFNWSGKIATFFARPLWKTENVIVDTAISSEVLVRTKNSVFNENKQLRTDNEYLKTNMIDYDLLKKENDQLKDLLGRTTVKNSFILGVVLTKPNRSPYDTIIIDGGISADMSEGMKVYADEKIPIGEISKVYKNAALVMLYSNPGQTTEAMLDGSNSSVELLGRGGGNFEMTLPVEVSSDKGSFVLVPGISEEVLAVVDAVISSPNDPIKKVLLHSPVNIQNLKWVQVKK